jgi:hypothetical protein
MSNTPQSARDDLAFLRSLVDAGDGMQRSFGEAYVAAGAAYGGQFVLSAAQGLGWLPTDKAWSLVIGIGPTIIFLPILAWIIFRNRRARPPGIVGRAIGSVFACAGAANIALIAVIGSVALREHSLTTWLIYPCAVYVLQGAAWLAAWTLRRRPWMAAVAAGWFVTGVAMALQVQTINAFVMIAGLGLILLMVVPGAFMMRANRDHS